MSSSRVGEGATIGSHAPVATADHGSRTEACSRTEHGQVTVFASVVLVLFVLCVVGLAGVATGVIDRARAQQAADAAALAAANRLDPVDGDRVAAVVARANGAEVVATRRVDRIVVVTVRVASIRSSAAARPVWRTR